MVGKEASCGCKWDMENGLRPCPTHAAPQDARVRELEARCREVAAMLLESSVDCPACYEAMTRLEEGL
jgi:hypothetical protein